MTTKKTQSSKSKNHGGKRPGAGRPKKIRTATAPNTGTETNNSLMDAETYLAKVVSGELPPDPDRIRAATCLIRYQESKKRVPKRSLTPKQLDLKKRASEERGIVEDFEQKAREIRERHRRKRNGTD